MENRHTIFISYSSKDKATAAALCAHLEKAQLKCWMAPRDIAPGKDYAASIIEAINQSAIMILVFSQHSNDSDHVLNEVERAFNKKITIIPFRITDTIPSASMEYFLSLKHWLDAFENKPSQYFKEVQKICNELLDNPNATTSVPAHQTAPTAAKKYKPFLYGLGILAVMLIGCFIWSGNNGKMKAIATSDSIAKHEKQVMRRQLDILTKPVQEPVENTRQTSAPPRTPDTPKMESMTRFAESLGNHTEFSNPTKSDYLKFDKSNGNDYDFVGKISNTAITGTVRQVGHSKYKITSSSTVKGHFNVSNNEVTGNLVLTEDNLVPGKFIVYKSE
jgi:TIR domain